MINIISLFRSVVSGSELYFNAIFHAPCCAVRLAVAGALISTFGAKLYLISAFGGIVPFWDQWDAEAALVYVPYLESHFDVWQLIAPHNEHRVLFTRLLALALLEIAGHWDTLLQMVVNAALYAASLGLLLRIVSRVLSNADGVIATLVSGGIFTIPIGWENTLWGFQSQFYFLMIFSFVAIMLTLPAKAFELRWVAGTALAAMSYLCAASGALTLIPVIAVALIQLLVGARRGTREWLALGLHAGIVAGLLLTVPEVKAPAPLRAQSYVHFAAAFSHVLAWPILDRPIDRIALLWPSVVQFPIVLLGTWLIITRPPPKSPTWVVAAIGAWVIVQSASFAYGRAGAVFASRYLEILSVGLVVNSIAVVFLIRRATGPLFLRFAVACMAVLWLTAIASGVVGNALPRALTGVAERGRTGQAHVEFIGRFLRAGKDGSLQAAKPYNELPYANPDRLEALLSIPLIRQILPIELYGDAGPVATRQRPLLFGARFYLGVARLKQALLSKAAALWPRLGAPNHSPGMRRWLNQTKMCLHHRPEQRSDMIQTLDVDISVPLVVDLGGTLLLTDTIVENFSCLLFDRPLAACASLFAIGDRAAFKRRLAHHILPDLQFLPQRQELVDLIRQERARGRAVHLVTAADQKIADGIAAALGLFDSVMGSDGLRNLKGNIKLALMQDRFAEGFIYAGENAATCRCSQRRAE